MPSPAAIKFQNAMGRAFVLHGVIGDARLRPQPFDDRESLCHAFLAAAVASWNGYVVSVARDFFPATADPTNIPFNAMHTLNGNLLDAALKKFNTPNAENSRNLLLAYTGYDPWGDWVWASRGMNGLQTRERLNEILQVRHSFAHGFTAHPYVWLQSSGGKVQLSKAAANMTHALLTHLVKQTDRGLKNHIKSIYGKTIW